MKKVLIITLVGDSNYGNRLQNYAMQTILEKRNFEVTTIKKLYTDKETTLLKKKIKFSEYEYFCQFVKNNIKKFMRFYNNKENANKCKQKRKENFIKFIDKYIHVMKEDITESNIDNLSKKYDYFIIGSDQIWNPFNITSFKFCFAEFADYDNAISYSASMGLNKIPKIFNDFYKRGLDNIKYISVREEAGAKIVKELTNRDVQVLVDPTMLLTADEWRNIAIKPKNIENKKYILTYFLGKISKKRKNFLEKVAKENNLEIINMVQIEESETYIAGPAEFLSYIDNATIVFTDSFHACVFSILFKTSFYVLDRENNAHNMNSRLDTLLSKFKLEDRKLNSYEDKVLVDIDYSHIDKILTGERKKSDEYLIKALNIDKKV